MSLEIEANDAQAIYLSELNRIAKSKSTFATKDALGRSIVEVSLTELDWNRIMQKIPNLQPAPSAQELEQFKKDFIKCLGHPVSDLSIVSLDKQESNPISLLRYRLSENIFSAFQAIAKSQVINLHQESYFHAHLMNRMLMDSVKESGQAVNEVAFKAGVEKALEELEHVTSKLYESAIKAAYSEAEHNGKVDLTLFRHALNRELDTSRKTLLPFIVKHLRQNVIKTTGIVFDKNITKHISKHLAEQTTATNSDFVQISKELGMISYIGANHHTAHHRELGGSKVADRLLYSHQIVDGRVTPLSNRVQVRTPSIALKGLHNMTKRLLAQDEFVVDKSDYVVESYISKLDPNKKLPEKERQLIINEYHSINRRLLFIVNSNIQPPNDNDIKKATNLMIINDAAEKLVHLQDKYSLGGDARLHGNAIPNAFIYNLYTTLNSGISGRLDERRNQ
jgi:hypothetical protein